MGRARPEIPVRPRPKKRFSSALPAVCTPRPARTLTQGQAAVCANRPHPRAQARQGCRKGRAARFCRRALARLHACVPGRSRCARAIRSRPMHTRGAAAGLACGSSGGLLTGHSCLRGIRRRLAMRGAAARAFAWRFCSYLDTRFCLSNKQTARSACKHCEARYQNRKNLWISKKTDSPKSAQIWQSPPQKIRRTANKTDCRPTQLPGIRLSGFQTTRPHRRSARFPERPRRVKFGYKILLTK